MHQLNSRKGDGMKLDALHGLFFYLCFASIAATMKFKPLQFALWLFIAGVSFGTALNAGWLVFLGLALPPALLGGWLLYSLSNS